MNFKNIGILDDSIGGIYVLNSLKEVYNENFIYYADLEEYPYGVKNLSLKSLSNKAADNIIKENLKVLIITNPAIAMNIDKKDLITVNGIESAIEDLKNNNTLILGSKATINSEYLKEITKDKGFILKDAQILINMIQDSDTNHYIVFKLIEEYIENFNGNILLLDSNLSLFKDKILNYNNDLKIYTLNDYIIKDFKEIFTKDLKHYYKNKTKIKYLVSNYRIAFYYAAEEFYSGRYSAVKKI